MRMEQLAVNQQDYYHHHKNIHFFTQNGQLGLLIQNTQSIETLQPMQKCQHGQNAHQVKRQHILDTQCLDCHNQCGQITSLSFWSVIFLEVCVIVFRIQSTTGFTYKTHNQSIKSREQIEGWHFANL